VPSPIIWLHVAKGCVDATLSGNCVTSGGEQFCDDGGFEAFLNKTECSSEASTTGSNNYSIIASYV